MRSPADASPAPSGVPTHGSGPMWIATPSPSWTLTTYSLPLFPAHIAVGVAIAGAPRTDPDVPDSGIRLLPRVFDGETLAWPGVKDFWFGEKVVGQLRSEERRVGK